jgi:hypothetical protein
MNARSVVKLYMHLTGGVDSGLNELDVLNYWRKQTWNKRHIKQIDIRADPGIRPEQ